MSGTTCAAAPTVASAFLSTALHFCSENRAYHQNPLLFHPFSNFLLRSHTPLNVALCQRPFAASCGGASNCVRTFFFQLSFTTDVEIFNLKANGFIVARATRFLINSLRNSSRRCYCPRCHVPCCLCECPVQCKRLHLCKCGYRLRLRLLRHLRSHSALYQG